MLSGIGPANQLAEVSVTSVIDLPDVGDNLQDQTILALQYEVNGTTLSPLFNDGAAFAAALAQWKENRTGIAAGNTVVNTLGYLRLPPGSPLLMTCDPAAGPNAAHYSMVFLVCAQVSLPDSINGRPRRVPFTRTQVRRHRPRAIG